MYNSNENKFAISTVFFEPTYTIFDNAVVLNYKKSGTRFFAHMAAYPYNYWQENNHQYDMCFSRKQFDSSDDTRNYLNFDFGTYYANINFEQEGYINTPNNYNSFYDNYGVSDINNFVLNNPKNLYVVIKNPIDRFLSGLVQILDVYLREQLISDVEKERLQKFVDITDFEIEHIKSNFDKMFNQFAENIQYDALDMSLVAKVLNFIIQYNTNYWMKDMHTQNCLHAVKEIIYNNIDKNKIKIISLEHCKSKRAFRLFDSWNNEKSVFDMYNEKSKYVMSNKIIYDCIYKYDFSQDNREILSNYLKDEYSHYSSLIQSKMYLNLE